MLDANVLMKELIILATSNLVQLLISQQQQRVGFNILVSTLMCLYYYMLLGQSNLNLVWVISVC